MKKVLFFLTAVMLLAFVSNETFAGPRPFYLGVRLGFLAKWAIVLGECDPGWGICISVDDGTGQNYLGYDTDNNKFTLRISKSYPEAKNLKSGVLEIKEDSPIDPAVIKQFPGLQRINKIVVIKKGVYKVLEVGDFYEVTVDYYLQ